MDEQYDGGRSASPTGNTVLSRRKLLRGGLGVLQRFTGSDRLNASYTQRAGMSAFEPGVLPATDVTLSWATFSQAADQAGLSRRYGGIHFEPGDMEGRRMGRLVGAQVWNKGLSYINGSK